MGYLLHETEGALECGFAKDTRNVWRGVDCSEEGSSISNLHLRKGFWRTSSSSDQIFECEDGKDGPCRGGNKTDDQCRDGHESYLCSVCEEEWYKYGSECYPCKFDSLIFVVTIVAVLMIAVGTALVICCYGEELEQRIHYFISPAVRSRSKIIVSFSQIMFTLPGMLALGMR